jgi:hypothetical protein
MPGNAFSRVRSIARTRKACLMADLRFRILLIASAVVLVFAVIDVVRLIRTRHAARPGTEGPRGARAPGSQAADPGPSAGPSATTRRP